MLHAFGFGHDLETGIQRLELPGEIEAAVDDDAIGHPMAFDVADEVVRGGVDRAVMDEDELTGGGGSNIDFDEVGAEADGLFERWNRVLRVVEVFAAVRNCNDMARLRGR